MSGGLDARSLQDMRERAEGLLAVVTDGDGDERWVHLADARLIVASVRDVLVLLEERERLEASLRDAQGALRDVTRYLKSALEHIKDDLQPAFEQFAESGTFPGPSSPEYTESDRAWRLATWWHGVGDDDVIRRASELAARLTVGERASLDSPEAQQ